jgi:hypothetical protein
VDPTIPAGQVQFSSRDVDPAIVVDGPAGSVTWNYTDVMLESIPSKVQPEWRYQRLIDTRVETWAAGPLNVLSAFRDG